MWPTFPSKSGCDADVARFRRTFIFSRTKKYPLLNRTFRKKTLSFIFTSADRNQCHSRFQFGQTRAQEPFHKLFRSRGRVPGLRNLEATSKGPLFSIAHAKRTVKSIYNNMSSMIKIIITPVQALDQGWKSIAARHGTGTRHGTVRYAPCRAVP